MRASTVINHVRTLLGDPDGDYHSDTKMLLHLNAALEDICDRSRSVRVASNQALIADQSAYGLPESFLEADIVGVIYQGRWRELDYAHIGEQLGQINTDFDYGSLAPFRYTIWGNAHVERYVGTVIANPSDPSADNSGETTFWSSVPLTNALPGDRLINITDDSEGIISELAGGFSNVTFLNLAGGEDNAMQVDDEFRILSPDASRKNLVISPAPSSNDEGGVESLFLYHSRSHKLMTQTEIDDGNDTLEIDTEFASTLRHRISYYAALDEKGSTLQRHRASISSLKPTTLAPIY